MLFYPAFRANRLSEAFSFPLSGRRVRGEAPCRVKPGNCNAFSPMTTCFRHGFVSLRARVCVLNTWALPVNTVKDERGDGTKAWDMCLELKEKGLLAKPTHGEHVRVTYCITTQK